MKHIIFIVALFVVTFSAHSQSNSDKMSTENITLLKTNFFSRNLHVHSKDGYIEITPFYGEVSKKLDMLVKGPVICYNGTLLKLELANNTALEKKSFNEFNTTGVLFFLPFTEDEKKLLERSKLKSISLIDERKTIFCPVPENESDYFIQVMIIDKGRAEY